MNPCFRNYPPNYKYNPNEQENRKTSITGSIIARAVEWFKDENDTESVRLLKKVGAIALAILLAVSVVGILYLLEGIYAWENCRVSRIEQKYPDRKGVVEETSSNNHHLSEEMLGNLVENSDQTASDENYISSWSYEDSEEYSTSDDHLVEIISENPKPKVELEGNSSGEDYIEMPTLPVDLEGSTSGEYCQYEKEQNENPHDPNLGLMGLTPKAEPTFNKVEAASTYQMPKPDDALNDLLSKMLFDSAQTKDFMFTPITHHSKAYALDTKIHDLEKELVFLKKSSAFMTI